MRALGADPGLTGAVAVVENGRLQCARRLPVMETRRGQMLDAAELARWLNGRPAVDVVVIERAQAMPRQGVASSFNYGRACGALDAVLRLACPEARMEWVAPSSWKRALGLNADKNRSLAEATLRFGEAARREYWPRKSDNGVAEASLLAAWAAERLG